MAIWMGLAAVCAVLAILCEERAAGRHPAFFLLKPGTTLLFLAAAWTAPDADATYRNWICAGLLLSTCGDAALMYSGERAFMAGLGSFLVAHLLFIVGFAADTPLMLPPAWTLAVLVPALLFFGWLLPRTGPLWPAVTVYGAVLAAMALVAATRATVVPHMGALLASIGSVVFLLSDASLAVCQFQGAYRRAQTLILSTYWIAVAGIAASVWGSAPGAW